MKMDYIYLKKIFLNGGSISHSVQYLLHICALKNVLFIRDSNLTGHAMFYLLNLVTWSFCDSWSSRPGRKLRQKQMCLDTPPPTPEVTLQPRAPHTKVRMVSLDVCSTNVKKGLLACGDITIWWVLLYVCKCWEVPGDTTHFLGDNTEVWKREAT